jgi:hypothetical protein
LNIVKTTKIYESDAPLSEVGGSFSDLSLWAFWRENGSLKAQYLLKSAVTDKKGVYKGSLVDGKWSEPITLTDNSTVDTNPALITDNGRISALIWERNGKLFFAPPWHPMLTETFSSRVITGFIVCGDSKRKEWPVDFIIYLYDTNGNVKHTETVIGNTEIKWEKQIEQTSEIVKAVLEIVRWSHAGRQAKILQFFSSLSETYTGDDLFSISLIEEREISDSSTFPIGNISSNELDVSIYNRDHKFDAGNSDSKLYQSVKPNRRIKAWLGLVAEASEPDYMIAPGMCLEYDKKIDGAETVWVPLGTFYTKDWDVPERGLNADTTAQDKLMLLDNTYYKADEFLKDATLYEVALDVLTDGGLRTAEYIIDEELKDFTVAWGCAIAKPNDTSHRECLRIIVEACLGQCYIDRDGLLRIEGPSYLEKEKTAVNLKITGDDYFDKDNPGDYDGLANYVTITAQPLTAATETEEVYTTDDETPESINAGERKTITVEYTNGPAINSQRR